ncbi:MAG: hypothetical protein HZA15_14480 [Nitrospirae bacterium]|nr:hypothetical protein [Nitrospirota bacterium]
MMKIILSRKGFDSKNGKVASPILPSGVLCSLPIPDVENPKGRNSKRYEEIMVGNESMGKIVSDLTKGKIKPTDYPHFDPDLNANSIPRKPQWKGVFGQASAAQTHLRNQGVKQGNVFLFFGWFKEVECVNGFYRHISGAPDRHVMFGWLQVERRIPETQLSQIPDWASDHPHCRNVKREVDSVYIASDKFTIRQNDIGLPGFGVFPRFTSLLCLTASRHSRKWWSLPRWFYPATRKSSLSYHSDLTRWQLEDDAVLLKSADIGQEFVLDCDDFPEAIDWLGEIMKVASG